MSAPVLEIKNLNVGYGLGDQGVRAVRDVNLTLHRGEVLGLAGESGSGKSTLAYGMTRLLAPPGVITGGQVIYHPAEGDPYDVLGVSRSASEADIKTAFRRLAAQHHPDRNPDDPNAQTRFKEINAAYQILADPNKRAAFDRYGAQAFQPGGRGGADFVDLGGLDEIFGDILGAFGFKSGDFPVAEHYYSGALSLPLYPDLGEADQDRVVAALQALLAA